MHSLAGQECRSAGFYSQYLQMDDNSKLILLAAAITNHTNPLEG